MKKIFRNYFMLLLMILSIINVDILMPISDNGTLNVALVELLLPVLIIIIFIVFMKRKKEMIYKKIINAIIIFSIYYVIIFLLRYFLNLEFKQSLLTIKVTIFPIVIIFMSRYMKIPKENIIKCLLIFNTMINIIQLPNYTNVRMSMFLGNIVVYLTLIEVLYYINYNVLFDRNYGYILKIMAIFNIFICTTVPLLTGSRSTFYIMLMINIIFIVYYLYKKQYVRFLIVVAFLLLSTGINIVFWNTNKVASYANRVLPQIFNSEDVKVDDDTKTDIENDNNKTKKENDNKKEDVVDKTTIIERDKSDGLRNELFRKSINEIKKSPIIGTGVIYFDVDTDYGVSLQSAHNFILEYINAYGIVGMILLLYIHFCIFKTINLKNKSILYMMIFTSGIMVIQSLVEPTLIIVPTVIIFMILYSLFLNWEVQDV